jgi:hypothetical protein
VEWIELAQDRAPWRALVNTVMHKNKGHIFQFRKSCKLEDGRVYGFGVAFIPLFVRNLRSSLH